MRNVKGIILSLCCLISLAACERDKTYDSFRHTPVEGWEQEDTLFFDIPPMKEGGAYALSLTLRLANNYPYQNLSLKVFQTVISTDSANQRRQQQTTLSLPVGTIDGDNGVALHEASARVSLLRLAEGDSLHVAVCHDMRRETMPGIDDVGIVMRRVKR